jgi:DNA-binding NarL/FixJ family response regulator
VTAPIRVVIVDDQQMIRAGIAMILDLESDIDVVGEASNGREALDLVRSITADVVLMDVQMPEMDGLQATRRIVAEIDRPPHVVILTTFERDEYIFDALRAGASGFLLKNAPPEDLIDAIRIVASGEALLSPSVTRRVIGSFNGTAVPTAPPDEVRFLTERELEVLAKVAEGLSNAEIASALFVGEATVKTHVSNVLAKLHLRDRVQAVVYAHRHGLLG